MNPNDWKELTHVSSNDEDVLFTLGNRRRPGLRRRPGPDRPYDRSRPRTEVEETEFVGPDDSWLPDPIPDEETPGYDPGLEDIVPENSLAELVPDEELPEFSVDIPEESTPLLEPDEETDEFQGFDIPTDDLGRPVDGASSGSVGGSKAAIDGAVLTVGSIAVGAGIGAAAAAATGLVSRTRQKGLVLPDSEYIGPGNPIPIGAAKNPTEQVARDHDLAYKEISSKPFSSRAEHHEAVFEADKKAIQDFEKQGTFYGKIGALGLKTKVAVESSFGVFYPPYKGKYFFIFFINVVLCYVFAVARKTKPNPPPWEHKPEQWQKLNEGQRRYAYEQWMLSRVRRGLPIDHPIPGNGKSIERAEL